MSKLIKIALAAVAIIGITSSANAATAILATNDFVGISFWIVSMGCLAATAFFFLERGSVAPQWRVSITVAGLVTGIAFIHYMYMRDIWISTGESPTVYRYIDWLITVPLLMVEFYIILRAIGAVSVGIFWRLMIGSVVMLLAGYMGEAGYVNAWAGFIVGLAGWVYILYEIFAGEAGKLAADKASASVQSAFSTMRWIVTIGWAIYPLGYFFGYLTNAADVEMLNIIYNFADVLNKIAFGVIIWNVAITESK